MLVVESDFEYKGYRCVIVFNDRGIRCGYVGLPKGHALYGKGFGSQLKATYKDIGEELGKRSPLQAFYLWGSDPDNRVELEMYFNVHGGVTYASDGKESKYPVESDLWWIGFDCGHAGDAPDLDLVEKLWGDDPKIRQRLDFEYEYPLHFDDDVLRSNEYVQQECRSLVDQIIDYCERYERL